MGIKSLCTLFLLSALLSCKTAKKLENATGYLAETQLFEFYSHFWLNMHHFLYNKALALQEKSIAELFEDDLWDQLSPSEQETLTTALNYYQDNLIAEDLRMGEYLSGFKTWVVRQASNQALPVNDQMKKHQMILNNTGNIYQKYWWDAHAQEHKKVLSENLSLIKKLEIPAKEKLTQLVKAEWQKDKIRVDICTYVKQDRPFTSNHPTHIVMNAGKNAKPAGNWFEILIHEASHHFIFSRSGFIGETINQAAEELEKNPPRGLWHAYLFYFTGHISQELLIEEGISDYQTYMVRRNVFHWYMPQLKAHLPDFIKGEKTLLECSKQIITEINR